MPNNNIRSKVEEALNSIRPYLEADGGNVELIDISADNVVQVELIGACKTCSMNMMTMKAGIEETIKRSVPEVKSVISVSN
jgi:Fe-S cluster biogenesis protein NfuA